MKNLNNPTQPNWSELDQIKNELESIYAEAILMQKIIKVSQGKALLAIQNIKRIMESMGVKR